MVTPAIFTPYANVSATGCAPGNAGKSVGWTFDNPVPVLPHEGRLKQLHKTRKDYQFNSIVFNEP